MGEFKDNFLEVFSNWRYLIIGIVMLILLNFLFFCFTDSALIKGNLGLTYFYINTILQITISFLFSIFVPLSLYKIFKFSSFTFKDNSLSGTATFLGVLVAGCPACSVSVASFIGIASVISLFPYYGLELKIIAVPMLLYANYSVLKDLNVCRLKRNL